MPDSDLSTEQSMDEILKKIERKLVEEGKPEEPAGSAPQSAEVLKLSDAAGDNRKGRAQNRGRPSGQETNGASGRLSALPGEEQDGENSAKITTKTWPIPKNIRQQS